MEGDVDICEKRNCFLVMDCHHYNPWNMYESRNGRKLHINQVFSYVDNDRQRCIQKGGLIFVNEEQGKQKRKKPKRFKQYRLRMTDKEADRLKTLSEQTGMSCADVMRDALDKYEGNV